jgi:hypothetical protein
MTNLAEHKHKVLQSAKRNVRTKAMKKSLDALSHQNNPNAEKPPPSHEFLAITEEAHMGRRTVEKGDGSTIEFKDAQYKTNDAAEAALLERTPGVSVERYKHTERSRIYVVPAMPWHGDDSG